jgi:hypothetical protein
MRGNAMIACASGTTACGSQPLLLASPDTFTCTQICNGGSASGRWSDSRRAMRSFSTDCTQSNDSAILRVLLDWIGPMKCHSSGARDPAVSGTAAVRSAPGQPGRRCASAVILASASCR